MQLGYRNVYRYPQGFPEWQAAGLPSAQPEITHTAPLEPTPQKRARGWTLLWTLLSVFAGGLALNLTPCVYPLIPITVAYFSGRGKAGKGSTIIHGLCYIGGLALVNSVLGVVAALSGGLMGEILQSPWVLTVIALVLLAFATSLFGFWELRLPFGLTQWASKSYSGYAGSLFMGGTLGVVAAPCIGPFVLGLLAWVAAVGEPLFGWAVFFTLSIGLGTPLFVLALFSGQMVKLPRSGHWMIWVRHLMGWVLVGVAAYFARPVLPLPISTHALAVVALAAGLHLGWLVRVPDSFRGFPWIKTGIGVACLILAANLSFSHVFKGPGVDWKPYSPAILRQAVTQQKPVIIDFSADWCSPCRRLDETTFHHPELVALARKEFIMVKVDLTRETSPQYQDIVRQYGVKGVPTVVFLTKAGQENTALRLLDYTPPEEFLVRMAALR